MTSFNDELSGFHGTQTWTKFTPLSRTVLSEGAMELGRKYDAFGLLQDIAIDLECREEVKKALYLGLVEVFIDTQGFGLRYEDGNDNVIFSYPLIGYPTIKGKVWASMVDETTATIFLPSEY